MWYKKIVADIYNLYYGKQKCRKIAEEAGKVLIELENGARHLVWKNKISNKPTFDNKDHIQDLMCEHCGYLNKRDSKTCYECEKDINES
jgi:hypothetical protein